MKKTVVVRKNSVLRNCFRVGTAVIVTACLVTICCNRYPLLLIFGPMSGIFAFLLLYIESWNIEFSADRIKQKRFSLTKGDYSYTELREILFSYSLSDHEYVLLVFDSGKHIRFLMKDENAQKALRILGQHKSIRYIN